MVDPGQRALVLAPLYDTPGRRDASGAFLPESRKFVAANKLAAIVRGFDSNRALADRRRECSLALSRATDLDVVALFCHGWRNGVQAGWTTAHAPGLADLIALASRRSSIVCLYCCDTGRDADKETDDDRQDSIGGQGGFADLLYEALRGRGWAGRLFGHTTAGHTTTNPWVRIWGDWGVGDLQDGNWLVEPKGALWPAWRAALQGDLRLRFPFMDADEVRGVLAR